MIRPVTWTIDVPQSRERVFEQLDPLADHERFSDHFLVDWSVSGPRRGVGAKARKPLTRVVTRRANARSLCRLADERSLTALDPDRPEPQPDKEGKR